MSSSSGGKSKKGVFKSAVNKLALVHRVKSGGVTTASPGGGGFYQPPVQKQDPLSVKSEHTRVSDYRDIAPEFPKKRTKLTEHRRSSSSGSLGTGSETTNTTTWSEPIRPSRSGAFDDEETDTSRPFTKSSPSEAISSGTEVSNEKESDKQSFLPSIQQRIARTFSAPGPLSAGLKASSSKEPDAASATKNTEAPASPASRTKADARSTSDKDINRRSTGSSGRGSRSSSKQRSRREKKVRLSSEQRRELMERLNEDYTDFLLQNAGVSAVKETSIIQIHLAAADHLLKQFFATVQVICAAGTNSLGSSSSTGSASKPPGPTVNMIWNVYEDFLYPRISDHYNRTVPRLGPTVSSKRGSDKFLGKTVGGPGIVVDTSTRSIGSSDTVLSSFYLDCHSESFFTSNIRTANSRHTVSVIYDDVTPTDSIAIVSWIDKLLGTLKATSIKQQQQEQTKSVEYQEPFLIEYSPDWRKDQDRLVAFYLAGLQADVRRFLDRTVKLQADSDIQQDLMDAPEQYQNQIQQHLSKAKKLSLPNKYQEQVLAACNDVLSAFVEEEMVQVSAQWKHMSINRFHSLIHDAAKLSDIMEELNEAWLKSEEYVQAGEDLVCDLAELSLHTTYYLCIRTIQDPADPVLSSVGDVEWESDPTHSAINQTIANLQTFLQGLEDWLNADYLAPKVLKCCFDITVQAYIESFIANTIARGLQNPKTASRKLSYDYLRLRNFFNNDEIVKEYHGVAGFYSSDAMIKRLQVLNSLSMLVDPNMPPEALMEDVKLIWLLFKSGETGTPVVLHLAGLRKRHKGKEAVEWLQIIARAKISIERERRKEQEELESTDDISILTDDNDAVPSRARSNGRQQQHNQHSSVIPAYYYKTPDVRNSGYVRNIQPLLSDIKDLSVRSAVQAASARRLLRGPDGRPLDGRTFAFGSLLALLGFNFAWWDGR